MTTETTAPLPAEALRGIELFNEGEYFEAHEALENAWRAEPGPIRNLYQGILQVAVCYLHITRNNHEGAVKMYGRCMRLLGPLPSPCQGVNVEALRQNVGRVIAEVERLGPGNLASFNAHLFGKVELTSHDTQPKTYICDRCGTQMQERNCKITCPNCGNRFDCSDLNIYFD